MENKKQLTFKTFLWFKLETGSLFFGWYLIAKTIIIIAISLLISIVLIIGQSKIGTSPLAGATTAVSILAFGFSVGFATIGYKCIKGTKTRDVSKLQPARITLAYMTFFCYILLFSCNLQVTLIGLINGAVTGYLLVVLNSHYYQLKNEQ